MTRRSILTATFLIGLAAATVMIAQQGFGTVGATIASAGWGVLVLPFVFFPNVALSAVGWQLLFVRDGAPRFTDTLRAMWVGFAMDTLVPLGVIGSKIVRARLLIHKGVSPPYAVASVVVDVTLNILAITLVAACGVVSLVVLRADGEILIWTLTAVALLGVGIAALLIAQRWGIIRRLGKIVARRSQSGELVRNIHELEEIVIELYTRVGRVSLACFLKFAGHLFVATEIWIAFQLMGHPITPIEAIMLRSLVLALRAAAFFVPIGAGIQEAGYILLGAVLGLAPDLALAVSLATRAREVLFGLPGLLDWQLSEGLAFRRARANSAR